MLRLEAEGPVLRITLARPEVKNAFNEELIVALAHAFSTLDAGIRAVVLAGDGDAFCAGGDLSWMRKAAQATQDENERDAKRLAMLFHHIAHCHALVIARVHGAAYGGGCGLVAAADVAIASTAARFSFSEVRLGLIPAAISTVVLQKIGSGHSRALFTTGEAFDAHRAERIGLVHEVVEEDALESTINRKVAAVLASGPKAVHAAKLIAQEAPLSPEEAAVRLAAVRVTEEAREGIAAFLEKRPALFVVKP